MTTYYADFDLGTGNNDGTSWANAWKTPADVIAGSNGSAPAAGDTVYTRGTATLAATVTNTLAGDETTGLIKWIGCNASGNNDGTRTVIDANSGNFATWTQNAGYNLFENFRFTGSGNNDGFEGTGDDLVFVNCSFDNNNAHGWNGAGQDRCIFIRCVAYSNGSNGFSGAGARFIFCCSRGNTGNGWYYNFASVWIGCLAYDNGGNGIDAFRQYGTAFNSVFDANTGNGIDILSGTNYVAAILGCRITNHSGGGSIGLDANTEIVLYGWNYFENNTGDNVQNATLAFPISYNGAATNLEDLSNTEYGYVDISEDNYATGYTDSGDPDLRRVAVTIPTS